MKLTWLVLAFPLTLAGCAVDGNNLQPGVADGPAVQAQMGKPAEVLKTAQGNEVWFYPRGRVGRQTHRVEFDSTGRMLSVDQVLHEWNFDRIIAGKTTGTELRELLGPPNMEWVPMNGWERNLEYRYWWGANQMWVVHFGVDQKGIVTGQFRHSERDAPSERR